MITQDEIGGYLTDYEKIQVRVAQSNIVPQGRVADVAMAIFQVHEHHCAMHTTFSEGKKS